MNATAISDQWLERARRLLADARTPLAVSAVLAVAVGWQLPQLTWMLLPAPGTAAPPASAITTEGSSVAGDEGRDSAARVASLHLFGQPSASNPSTGTESAQAPTDAPETQLNLDLRGVFAPGSGEGLAIIAASGGREKIYAVGDMIAGSARITGIYGDRVVLDRNGNAETLRMSLADEAPASANRSATQASTQERRIAERARELRQRLLENPVELARMVRFQPYVQNDNLIGYRIQPRGADAEMLRELGLRPSDVVTSLNGRQLTNPRQANEALQSLRDARTINISFLRDGQSRTMTIPIGQAR